MITEVVGITLWTADLDRMVRFYRDTVRLPLHSFHEDEGFAAFQLGNSASTWVGMVKSRAHLGTHCGSCLTWV